MIYCPDCDEYTAEAVDDIDPPYVFLAHCSVHGEFQSIVQ